MARAPARAGIDDHAYLRRLALVVVVLGNIRALSKTFLTEPKACRGNANIPDPRAGDDETRRERRWRSKGRVAPGPAPAHKDFDSGGRGNTKPLPKPASLPQGKDSANAPRRTEG